MTKQETLNKLKEESSNLFYTVTVIRNLYLIYLVILVFVLLAVTIFQGQLTGLLQSGSVKAGYVSVMMKFFSPFPYLSSDSSPHLFFYLLGGVLAAGGAALNAAVFHIIVKVFKAARDGQTPFTLKTADYWKWLYKIYAVLTTLAFFSCFILGAAMLLVMISFLVYACFFLFLSLIFEYGSELQQESDETL